jgi:hypothetical protein
MVGGGPLVDDSRHIWMPQDALNVAFLIVTRETRCNFHGHTVSVHGVFGLNNLRNDAVD